ncbi:MAG TPA: hypothetical protein VGD37_11185 [Kofleriaceae bacterium]|jgi:hypothetical protein
MNHTTSASGRSRASACHPRLRTVTRPVALPATPSESLALRDLLEANLQALQALHEEHRRMLDTSLRTVDGASTELRNELRAIRNDRAPWVKALAETRALLFVALRELIIGGNDAELSMHLPRQEPVHPHSHKR